MIPKISFQVVPYLDRTTVDLETNVYQPVRSAIIKVMKEIINNKYSQVYGFTLTINPKKKFRGYYLQNYDDDVLHRRIGQILKSSRAWKDVCYFMYPEFGDKHGRLHYHGIVYNCYEVKFLKCLNFWKKHFGHPEPEMSLGSNRIWIGYCVKDDGHTGLYPFFNVTH